MLIWQYSNIGNIENVGSKQYTLIHLFTKEKTGCNHEDYEKKNKHCICRTYDQCVQNCFESKNAVSPAPCSIFACSLFWKLRI